MLDYNSSVIIVSHNSVIIDSLFICTCTGAVAFNGSYFPSGSELSNVHFTNVICTGHENSIIACQYTTPSSCPHSRDAGVRCIPGPGMVNLLIIIICKLRVI